MILPLVKLKSARSLLDHEPFKMLLQHDNSLFNLSESQPFLTHNSQFFNPNMEFPYNGMVYGCPDTVPLSSYDHQGIVVPFVQSLVLPISSFVGHSGSNLTVSTDATFPNTRDVSYVNEGGNGVWEQTGNNQIQDIPIWEQDDYDPYKELQSIISDEQLELHNVNNHNLAEVTTELNCLNVDSVSKPFEQNQQNHFNPFEARMDGASTSGGVMNERMACIDDDEDVWDFTLPEFNDDFAIQESCNGSSFPYNMHGYNNDGNDDPSIF
ncbi:unnamed protein product [Lactuca saligna]|uniref:Uncharacterized protein n=1 Tax=Lactuca saligna TaxID=75948 RepID=A0AA36EI58_LACSI|nr:unnamed protein product [Lactuca saligna]